MFGIHGTTQGLNGRRQNRDGTIIMVYIMPNPTTVLTGFVTLDSVFLLRDEYEYAFGRPSVYCSGGTYFMWF